MPARTQASMTGLDVRVGHAAVGADPHLQVVAVDGAPLAKQRR